VITRLFLIYMNHSQIGGTGFFISRTDMTFWFRLICRYLVGTEMSPSLCHHLMIASEVIKGYRINTVNEHNLRGLWHQESYMW